MQSAVETISDLSLKINITVPADKVKSAYDKRLNEIAKSAKVDGFRPGKVPVKYVKNMYGASVESEIVDDIVRNSFNEVCTEKNIAVAGIEKVDVNQNELGKDLEFSISVETFPKVEFTDSDFADAKVDKFSVKVTAKDVDESIEKLRKSHATWEVCGPNTKAKMGEKVKIDFTAVQDGEDLESGSANDFELELGSKYLIPGFEEGIVGHKVNDEFKLDLTFPEDYHAKEQAGKKATFTVTLKEIQKAVMPELNEEFLEKFGVTAESLAKVDDNDSKEAKDSNEESKDEKPVAKADLKDLVKEFKSKIKESLENEVKHQVDAKFKNAIFDALRSAKEINIPKTVVESEITDIIKQREEQYRQQTGDKNAKLNLNRDTFKEQAEKNVHLRLLVRGFIEQFDIKTDKEQVRAKLKEVMGGHDISDDILNWYYSEPQRLQQIEAVALEDVVTKKLEEKFAVTEKEVSFEELMSGK